jgi:hypothetical protein
MKKLFLAAGAVAAMALAATPAAAQRYHRGGHTSFSLVIGGGGYPGYGYSPYSYGYSPYDYGYAYPSAYTYAPAYYPGYSAYYGRDYRRDNWRRHHHHDRRYDRDYRYR